MTGTGGTERQESGKKTGLPSLKGAAAAVAIVSWTAFVLFYFYKYHSPIIRTHAGLDILGAVGFNLILFLLAAGLGLRVVRVLSGEKQSAQVPLAIACATGIGLIATLTFLAAAAHILGKAWVLWLMLVLVGIVSIRELRSVISRAGGCLFAPRETGIAEGMLALALAFILGAALIQALAPPLSWDALVYHLDIPKLYIRHGGLYRIEGNLNSNMPLLVEMLFTLNMALVGDTAAQLNHYMTGLLLLAGAAGLIKETGGSLRAGPVAALILVSSPTVYFVMISSYIDLSLALFILCGFWCVERSRKEGHHRWVWAGGLITGFALAAKYMAALGLISLVVLILLGPGRMKDKIRSALAFCFFAAIPFAPWLIKNAVLVHNPVYPFLTGVFGSGDWEPGTMAEYVAFDRHFGMGRGILDYLLLPFRLFTQAERFTLKFDAVFNPLLLVLGFIYLFLPGKSRPITRAWLFAVLLFACWALSSQQGRYLIPGVAILALPAGSAGAYIIDRAGKLSAVIACGLLAGFSLLILPEETLTAGTDLLAVSGNMPKKEYLRHNSFRPALKYIESIFWINDSTPPNSRIFVIGVNTLYYLDREYFADSVFEISQTKRLIAECDDAKAFRDRLLAEGFTHVLNAQKYPWDVPDYLPMETLDEFRRARVIFEEFKSRYTAVLYDDGKSEVLKITRPGP